ncbi:MAG: hypothetical protein AAGA11_01960 [Pseudomonadota bacterium]
MDALSPIRQHYAEAVCTGLEHAGQLIPAFASVDRAACLLPPPWSVLHHLPGRHGHVEKTSREQDLYHDRLVQLDASRRINNGQPSLWAAVFDRLLTHAPTRLLHLGCGSGYYTAILAALFPDAEVRFHDVHEPLRAHAAQLFATRQRVLVDDRHTVLDAIVCSFGCSRVAEPLVTRWQDGGVLLAPVTDRHGRGVFVEARRQGDRVEVRPLFYCAFSLDAEQAQFPQRIVWRDAVSAPWPTHGALDLGALFTATSSD